RPRSILSVSSPRRPRTRWPGPGVPSGISLTAHDSGGRARRRDVLLALMVPPIELLTASSTLGAVGTVDRWGYRQATPAAGAGQPRVRWSGGLRRGTDARRAARGTHRP